MVIGDYNVVFDETEKLGGGIQNFQSQREFKIHRELQNDGSQI